MAAEAAPLILSAVLDAPVQQRLDALRRAHFPPERNHLDAHVTLFHHLPGAEEDAVAGAVAAVVRAGRRRRWTSPACARWAAAWRSRSPRPSWPGSASDLARTWAPWLTAQDRAKRDLHVTVQNKVTPAGGASAARRADRRVRPRAHPGGGARAVALPRRPLGAGRPVRVRRGRKRTRRRFREPDARIPDAALRGTAHREPMHDDASTERGPPFSTSPNRRASRFTSTAAWRGSRSTA